MFVKNMYLVWCVLRQVMVSGNIVSGVNILILQFTVQYSTVSYLYYNIRSTIQLSSLPVPRWHCEVVLCMSGVTE